MLKKFLINVALLAAVSSAYASHWITADTKNGQELSADQDSIVRDGPYTKIWMRTTLSHPQKYGTSARQLKTVKVLWIFDCEKKTTSTGMSILTDVNGGGLATDPGTPDQFIDVVPDTTGDMVMADACSQK